MNLLAKLRGGYGFTIMEVVMAVAIVTTLSLITAPIVAEKMQESKAVKASIQIRNLGAAVATFFQDTAEFPTRAGADRDIIEVLRSGSDASLDPKFSASIPPLWGLTEVDEINNHLLKDNPGGVANGYKDNGAEWNGPYIGDIGQDPWGRNYLVIAKGFYDPGTPSSPIFAWIISGGPNETIETDMDSDVLNSDPEIGLSTSGDDIGSLFFTSV